MLKIRRFLVAFTLAIALLTGCTSQYLQLPSENSSHRIKSLVMHFTVTDYQRSEQILVEKGGLSAHYLVTDPTDETYKKGTADIIQLVPESERAWHAGVSQWQTRHHLNDSSIGIEIINQPECDWDDSQSNAHGEFAKNRLCVFPDFPPEQVSAIIRLAKDIIKRNPDIHPTAVVGHSDIAFNRKNDPGPRFPWFALYQAGVGAWYDEETQVRYWKTFNIVPPSIGLMQAAMASYGYGLTETGYADSATYNAIAAFQMHFLPWSVTGVNDSQTAAALFALLEKYFPTKAKILMNRYHEETRARQNPEIMPVVQGQVDDNFPQTKRSNRKNVNDKTVFKAYEGRGEIRITASQDATAVIKVNGETLNIATPLEAGTTYSYSLKKRSKKGLNTLDVSKISADDANVNIQIPWPTLVDNQQAWTSRFTQVDKLINEEIEDGFPGATLLVIKEGAVIKKTAYGYALRYAPDGSPLKNPVPMTTKTLFDLASNTKMFATNLALMSLVSNGKLDVDAPVYTYLPEYRGQGRDARTVRDLLSHQSGYGSEIRFFQHDEKTNDRFYSLSKQRTAELLTTKVPFRIGDGLEARYSDTNFMLLGLIVERITGMSLDNYCEQVIYGRLQLTHTVFTPLQKGILPEQFAATELMGNTRSGLTDFDKARDYTLRGEVHDEKAWYSMNGVSGHAGLFSNVDDMSVMLQLLLNGGGYGNTQLFSQSTLNLFTSPSSLDAGYGLGWRRAADGRNRWHFGPYASSHAYGHTGWTGTATVIDPDLDLAIVLLTNARHTQVSKDSKGNPHFAGSDFETGKYGSVISRIYEAVLTSQ